MLAQIFNLSQFLLQLVSALLQKQADCERVYIRLDLGMILQITQHWLVVLHRLAEVLLSYLGPLCKLHPLREEASKMILDRVQLGLMCLVVTVITSGTQKAAFAEAIVNARSLSMLTTIDCNWLNNLSSGVSLLSSRASPAMCFDRS